MIRSLTRFRGKRRREAENATITVNDTFAPNPDQLPAKLQQVMGLNPGKGRVTRMYEDPSLFSREEKRANSDRVIAYLQATGAVTPGMIQRAKRLWRATGRQDPLWRVLLRTDEVPRDTIFEAAAITYRFAPVEVSLLETVGLVDHLAKKWPESVLPRLVGLGVIPVIPSDRKRRPGVVTFAAYDPTRPEVRRMVETVASGTHSIRYLAQPDLERCIKAVSDFLPGVMPASIRTLGAKPAPETSEETLRKAA